MAIFSRRVLQRLLDATEHLLAPDQRDRRLQLLNAANEESLNTEWEVVLLYGLSQLGSVDYEPNAGGTTRPDLLFEGKDIAFIADVASVNDSAYEEANPLRRFEKELWRRVRKAGLTTSSFSYRVEADRSGPKTRLLLPRNDQWDALFDENFRNLLEWVRVQPDEPVGLHRKTDDIDVTFSYIPRQRYGGGSYSPYRSSSSLTQNPIFNALKRKKEQLKASGYAGLKGIILCDAGCHQIAYAERIVSRFLRGTSSIAFVTVCTIDGDRFSRGAIHVAARCFLNPKMSDHGELRRIDQLFTRELPPTLPAANDDVTNAINHLQWKNRRVGLGHHGGWTFWGGKYMRISSRALHELLAGKVSCEEFMREHRFIEDDNRPGINPFAGHLAEGKMITAVHVERSQDEDDDWLVFEFGEPDSAISDFRPTAVTKTDSKT